VAEHISSTLKMEALCSSKTSVATQRTTRRHIPEDDTLHNHRCENLKFYLHNSVLSSLTPFVDKIIGDPECGFLPIVY
jgi:hypothetical protein